jgi:hypothetical protein
VESGRARTIPVVNFGLLSIALDQFRLRDFLSFNHSVDDVLHLTWQDHVLDTCGCELDAVLFDLAARRTLISRSRSPRSPMRDQPACSPIDRSSSIRVLEINIQGALRVVLKDRVSCWTPT